MQQVADHALIIHVGDQSGGAPLRIVVDPPAIEQKNGAPILTIALSVVWESNRTARDKARELPRTLSRFRNSYLCESDRAEWSLEVSDPTTTDTCPICSGQAAPIAVLGLPVNIGEERSEESVSTFKLVLPFSLGSPSRN
jgi:hypothetical protein